VRLLDVDALREVSSDIGGSVFDRSYLPRLQRAKFLQWLSRRITMPVMPDDEPFDYLATQAVADFLSTTSNASLDGILYPSVQSGRGNLNVVLFHKAARVRLLDIPKGTQISTHLYLNNDDGVEIYPWVSEKLPAKPSEDPGPIRLDSGVPVYSRVQDLVDPEDYDREGREPALKLDTSDVQIHVVNRVKFDTESYAVQRHRG
jgi:hypothetical protein